MHGKIAASLILSILLPFLVNAQPCTTVSGQTVAFTLSPGSKASWNAPVASIKQFVPGSKIGFSFSAYQLPGGKIAFRTSSFKSDLASRISIYSVDGRRIGAIEMNIHTGREFDKQLAPGVYFARLETNGASVATTRFLVGR